MIRIRYRDTAGITPGFHAEASREGRTTTVYLLTGLTSAQRRAALRRLRIYAARGQCPPLPGWQMAIARAADRTRHGRASMAAYPWLTSVPVMAIAFAATVLLGTKAVTVHVLPPAAAAAAPPGAAPVLPPGPHPTARHAAAPRPVRVPAGHVPAAAASSPPPWPESTSSPITGPGPASSSSTATADPDAGVPDVTSSSVLAAPPPPPVRTSPDGPGTPTAAPSSPPPDPGGGGMCATVGGVAVCVNI